MTSGFLPPAEERQGLGISEHEGTAGLFFFPHVSSSHVIFFFMIPNLLYELAGTAIYSVDRRTVIFALAAANRITWPSLHHILCVM